MPIAPSHPPTASVLLADNLNRVLIVRAGDRWQLPGGIIESSESPRQAAEREACEELDLHDHHLLAVEWIAASRPGRRDRVALVFAGPELGPVDLDRIRLDTDELNAWGVVSRDDALPMLHPMIR